MILFPFHLPGVNRQPEVLNGAVQTDEIYPAFGIFQDQHDARPFSRLQRIVDGLTKALIKSNSMVVPVMGVWEMGVSMRLLFMLMNMSVFGRRI